MPVKTPPKKPGLCFYLFWPPLIFNLGSVLVVSAIYVAHFLDVPDRPMGYQIPPATMHFRLGLFIAGVEWFFVGLLGGAYYQRQKALLPLMFTHWVVDMWSYLLLFFR